MTGPVEMPTWAGGGPAPAAPREVADQRGQPPGDLGGGLVAALLGQLGVAGEVDEADRRRPRDPLAEPRPLQALLHVVDGVLGPDVLAVAPVDLQQGPLQEPDDAVPEPGA